MARIEVKSDVTGTVWKIETKAGDKVVIELLEYPTENEPAQGVITAGILVAGAAFVAYYVYAYWRLSQEGYRVSPQKILLILSTACGSICRTSP